MIVINDSSALTEVHFDGHSEKQVFVGNHLVWPTIDWNKYSFRLIATPNSVFFDYTASRNIDGITSMVIQDSYLGDFLEIEPSTKISVADMKYINYKGNNPYPTGGGDLYIYYAGNYISANMFDESVNYNPSGEHLPYNDINNSVLHIFKDLDYIGDNAFRAYSDNAEGILTIAFYKTVTKVPLLSPTALPKNFMEHGQIYVPKSLEQAFKNADVWKNYADIIKGY